jgi:hypothetical protein
MTAVALSGILTALIILPSGSQYSDNISAAFQLAVAAGNLVVHDCKPYSIGAGTEIAATVAERERGAPSHWRLYPRVRRAG